MGINNFFRLSFGGVALALIITGFAVYWQSLQLRQDVKQLVTIEEPIEDAVFKIELLSFKISDAIKMRAYLQNPAYNDTIRQSQKVLVQEFAAFQKFAQETQAIKQNRNFAAFYKKFDQLVSQLLQQYTLKSQASETHIKDLIIRLNHQQQQLHKIISQDIQPAIHAKNKQIFLHAQFSSLMIGIVVVVSLVCFGIGIFFMSKYVKTSLIDALLKLNNAAQKLAQGIYAEKWGSIPPPRKTSKEITQIFRSFNRMAAGLHVFIKQQKKNNAELHEINQNFVKAQKMAQLASWELNLKTKKIHWGKQMYKIYGLKAGQQIDIEVLTPQIHPNDIDKVVGNLTNLMTDCVPYTLEYRITHPNSNKWHFLHSEAEIIYDHQQQPVKAVGITQDITHLKHAQHLLESYRKILDEAAIVATTNVKGNITYVNDKFCQISQYSREELIGQTHRLLKSDVHPDSLYKNLWQTISRGGIWHGELKNRAKDGSYYWVNATIMPFLNEKGKPHTYMTIRFDITLQKNFERRLKTQIMELNDYKFAIDTAAIVAITDIKGRITYVNDKFCQISQYSREELIGQYHRILNSAHHSPDYIRQMWLTIAKGNVWRNEFRNQAKDGSCYWVDTTIVPFLDSTGKPYMYLTIRFDISNQKRLEEDLRSHQAHLEEKVAERTHELENERNRVKEMNEELVTQNELIADTNKNMTDSIEYAVKIQEATLPRIDKIKAELPELFILYKPRDIVSGDFYWFSVVDEQMVIAAVDCTGHGVPGAFMSMIGNQLLHDIVNGQGITEPHTILNKLNARIRIALKQDELDNQDGMDITLCVIDKYKHQLTFAGAKNSLVYTQNGVLKEAKGDRTSIGGFQRPDFESFTEHTLTIDSPEQTFYMFSDGYQDQMGGQRGRKFMRKNLYNIFQDIHDKQMPLQQQALDNAFNDWKGDDFEQLDDVLVIGFRVNI